MDFPLIAILLVILSLVNQISCDGDGHETSHQGARVKRISGGTQALSKAFKYAAFVYWFYPHPDREKLMRYTCTGTVIHQSWVLTSANCFHDIIIEQAKTDTETMIFDMKNSCNVRTGLISSWKTTPIYGIQDRFGSQVYVHTSFTKVSTMYDVDIAMIFVSQSFDFRSGGPAPFVRAIEFTANFPSNGIVLRNTDKCLVLGFGLPGDDKKRPGFRDGSSEWSTATMTGNGYGHNPLYNGYEYFTRDLQYFYAHAGGVEYCKHAQQYLNYKDAGEVDSFYLCAKSANETRPENTCWGDTGAALVCEGKLSGVLSQRRESSPCGGTKSYSLFTSVGHPDIYGWIKRYLKEETPKLNVGTPAMSTGAKFPT